MTTDRTASDFDTFLQSQKAQREEATALYQRPKLQWSHEVLKGVRSGPTESMLKIWYLGEAKARARHEENEIDLNEIRAALRGTKNKWLPAVTESREKFAVIETHKKFDWSELIALPLSPYSTAQENAATAKFDGNASMQKVN